ncbi:hypothetical protein BH09MYX1_BH09MYX1_65370 [soil metagenome]
MLVLATTPAYSQDGTPFYGSSGSPEEPAPPTLPDLPEAPAPPFGARGSFVVSTSAGAEFDAYWYSETAARGIGFSVAPAVDYFFLHNVSIGLDASFGSGMSRGYGADSSLIETRSSFVYVGPRFGVNLTINDYVSFNPQASFGVEWRKREQEVLSGSSSSVPSPIAAPSTTQAGFWVELFAPLLFHPRPHAFIGIGPRVFHEFARATGGPDVGGERTSIGGGLVIGGHWGGIAVPAKTPTAPAKRFGDAHQLVLATSGSAGWTTYGGTDSTSSSVYVAPGAEYFVGYRVAIGLGGYFNYAFSRGLDAQNGATVTAKYVAGGATASVAYDVRATDWLSIYPRASVSVGLDSYDGVEGLSRNRNSAFSIAARLFVPLLVHVAPHVSIGLGPFVDHDFVRQSDPRRVKPNLSTTVGASAYVAVWL